MAVNYTAILHGTRSEMALPGCLACQCQTSAAGAVGSVPAAASATAPDHELVHPGYPRMSLAGPASTPAIVSEA